MILKRTAAALFVLALVTGCAIAIDRLAGVTCHVYPTEAPATVEVDLEVRGLWHSVTLEFGDGRSIRYQDGAFQQPLPFEGRPIDSAVGARFRYSYREAIALGQKQFVVRLQETSLLRLQAERTVTEFRVDDQGRLVAGTTTGESLIDLLKPRPGEGDPVPLVGHYAELQLARQDLLAAPAEASAVVLVGLAQIVDRQGRVFAPESGTALHRSEFDPDRSELMTHMFFLQDVLSLSEIPRTVGLFFGRGVTLDHRFFHILVIPSSKRRKDLMKSVYVKGKDREERDEQAASSPGPVGKGSFLNFEEIRELVDGRPAGSRVRSLFVYKTPMSGTVLAKDGGVFVQGCVPESGAVPYLLMRSQTDDYQVVRPTVVEPMTSRGERVYWASWPHPVETLREVHGLLSGLRPEALKALSDDRLPGVPWADGLNILAARVLWRRDGVAPADALRFHLDLAYPLTRVTDKHGRSLASTEPRLGSTDATTRRPGSFAVGARLGAGQRLAPDEKFAFFVRPLQRTTAVVQDGTPLETGGASETVFHLSTFPFRDDAYFEVYAAVVAGSDWNQRLVDAFELTDTGVGGRIRLLSEPVWVDASGTGLPRAVGEVANPAPQILYPANEARMPDTFGLIGYAAALRPGETLYAAAARIKEEDSEHRRSYERVMIQPVPVSYTARGECNGAAHISTEPGHRAEVRLFRAPAGALVVEQGFDSWARLEEEVARVRGVAGWPALNAWSAPLVVQTAPK